MFDFRHNPATRSETICCRRPRFFSLLPLPRRPPRNKIWDGIWGNIRLTYILAYPYRMIVWMHNAPSPPQRSGWRRSFRDRFDGVTFYIYVYIKYVVDITSLYRPFYQNLFVVWELWSSILSQRTFRTDLLSTAQRRRRRVQRATIAHVYNIYKCKVLMYIYRYCPFIHHHSIKGGSRLNLF